MPIKQLDERVRMLPRLGKIKVGEKVSKNGVEYPQAVDYFICPPEVMQIYGEKPKKLEVLLPSEEIDITFPHWYKLYGKQRGLICKGDGETGIWKNEDGTKVERTCPCSHYDKGYCKMIGTLNFILSKIERMGVYQIVTSSFHSIINILDYLELMKATVGKISFIPLALEVRMEEFHPMVNGKQMRTINPILHLVLEESFETLARKAKAGTLDRKIRLGLSGTVELEKADSDDDIPEELLPHLMNNQDMRGVDAPPIEEPRKISPPLPQRIPEAKLKAEINEMFKKLGYTAGQKNKAWKKYPAVKDLHEVLSYAVEIEEMFDKLGYTKEQRDGAWRTFSDPRELHKQLKAILEINEKKTQPDGMEDLVKAGQKTPFSNETIPEDDFEDDYPPGWDNADIKETETLPLF